MKGRTKNAWALYTTSKTAPGTSNVSHRYVSLFFVSHYKLGLVHSFLGFPPAIFRVFPTFLRLLKPLETFENTNPFHFNPDSRQDSIQFIIKQHLKIIQPVILINFSNFQKRLLLHKVHLFHILIIIRLQLLDDFKFVYQFYCAFQSFIQSYYFYEFNGRLNR